MATDHYHFTELTDNGTLYIVRDVNVPLNEIDTVIYDEKADNYTTLHQEIVDEHDARILSEAGIVSDTNDAISNASSNLLNRLITRTELAGYNAVFLGDSYVYGTGSDTHSTVQRTGHRSYNDAERFSTLIADALGMTEFNFAIGGSGFVRDNCSSGEPFTNEDVRFIKQVDFAISEMSAEELADVRMVFIGGGLNDVNFANANGNAMETAAKNTAEYAASQFENALIVVVPMLWYNVGWNETAYNYWMRLKFGATQANANCIVIDNAWTWLFGWGDATGIHPNGVGHHRIAGFSVAGICGAPCIGHSWDRVVWQTGYSSAYHCYLNFMYGRMYFEPTYISGNLSAGVTHIGDVPDWCVPRETIYLNILKGNAVAGQIAIIGGDDQVNKGRVNAIAESSISSGFYVTGGTWFPAGIPYHN